MSGFLVFKVSLFAVSQSQSLKNSALTVFSNDLQSLFG